MPLIALGLNHQTAPLALREQVALADDRVPVALHELRALNGVHEAAVISQTRRGIPTSPLAPDQ